MAGKRKDMMFNYSIIFLGKIITRILSRTVKKMSPCYHLKKMMSNQKENGEEIIEADNKRIFKGGMSTKSGKA